MNGYNTKQGSLILSYLASLGDKYITAEELASGLAGKVGVTTVYRQLDKLERGGKVRKLIVDGIAGACYRYVGDDRGGGLRLMCGGCGKLLGLDCDEIGRFEQHLIKSHQFRIDTAKTVLYGTCGHCAETKNNSEVTKHEN